MIRLKVISYEMRVYRSRAKGARISEKGYLIITQLGQETELEVPR
jgi:hypothetical protein